MNIFKTFGNCLKGQAYNPSDGFDSFMFCRYLGMDKQTINLAQVINVYYNQLDNDSQYEFVRSLKTPYYIKWIKTDKQEETNEILEISKKYKISIQKAKDYKECLKSVM